jgi:hypothetical protein
MADGEALDVYAGKISCMVAKYANLGATLSDVEMVKKLLDTSSSATSRLCSSTRCSGG